VPHRDLSVEHFGTQVRKINFFTDFHGAQKLGIRLFSRPILASYLCLRLYISLDSPPSKSILQFIYCCSNGLLDDTNLVSASVRRYVIYGPYPSPYAAPDPQADVLQADVATMKTASSLNSHASRIARCERHSNCGTTSRQFKSEEMFFLCVCVCVCVCGK
jgi:hypothetical protein